MVAYARAKVERAELEARIEIRKVKPGPMPLPDARCQMPDASILFSKDSIVHIPDEEALATDAFRVLKPGGWFVASDWLISHDGELSPEMADYIAREDLDFRVASPARYRRALEAAGFVDVSLKIQQYLVPNRCSYVNEATFRLKEGNCEVDTLDRMESFAVQRGKGTARQPPLGVPRARRR